MAGIISHMRTLFITFFFLIFSCSTKPLSRSGKIPGKIRICTVGDVGDGSSRQIDVAKKMEETGCDWLVLLGDLIYPDGIKNSEDTILRERFFEPYKSFPRIYIVLGNHDYQGNVRAWTEIPDRDDRIIHPANFYRERIHDICLFFLDTNFASDRTLYEREVSWIRRAKNGCSHKVAFTHHPHTSSGARHGHARDDVKKFMEGEIIGDFQAVFSGHEHILSDEGTLKGTRQVISGAGGKVDRGHSNGFVVYTLDLNQPAKSTFEFIFL